MSTIFFVCNTKQSTIFPVNQGIDPLLAVHIQATLKEKKYPSFVRFMNLTIISAIVLNFGMNFRTDITERFIVTRLTKKISYECIN